MQMIVMLMLASSINLQPEGWPPHTPPQQGAPPSESPQCLTMPGPYRDWAAVVDLYSRASLSINSRLHSGVMAAAALRPLVYVAGNSKYFDLMATLDLQPFILNPDRWWPGGHGLPAALPVALLRLASHALILPAVELAWAICTAACSCRGTAPHMLYEHLGTLTS
ncbi:uncharacterized protein HaLaN_05015 [Haematococcus lacustris]|uniref:Polysaccharide pyruvyl transferase domain-containing protein n=1 Tax=Haematococcus lacustris TaxID=44745 RepID=A0A699YSN0_HAELA|nr:uncharacterized protein HaLaN_05015 [Haematococcus lacustris]